MTTYDLKQRPRNQMIRWPGQYYAEGDSITYPGGRSTKEIVPDSRIILETTDDEQLCAVVERNESGTKFTGHVVETYPPGTLAVRGSGKDADQPIDFTDQHIFTVQYLEQSAAKT